MKRKALVGVLGLIVLAVLGWVFTPTPAIVEIATVTQGRFERAVQEDGITRLRERYIISTPLGARVARIHLKQGDTVARDDTVATLWPAAPALLDERVRAEQVARTGAVQAAVARAQANVARARVALEQAQTELKRSDTLARQGFVSPNQNETNQLTVRLREKELDSARQDETAARYELEQSRVALRHFLAPGVPAGRQQALVVKAPISGRVLKLHQADEAMVAAGTPLMTLGDPGNLEVVVDVLTEDATQIKPGTAVQLTHWGGPDVLEGRVRLVEPAAFTKVSALGVEEQRVNTLIDITSPAPAWAVLGDGFKVDVRVLVQVVENAITVPVSALFPVGARAGLFVLDKGRVRLQEIDVAARNGEQAWVKSGLAPGTQVIIYPDTQLADGDRAQTR